MPKYANRSPIVFDSAAFGTAVHRSMRERKMNLSDLARATGVPASTVTRITVGKPPSIDNFIALLHWLGGTAREFMIESVSHV